MIMFFFMLNYGIVDGYNSRSTSQGRSAAHPPSLWAFIGLGAIVAMKPYQNDRITSLGRTKNCI